MEQCVVMWRKTKRRCGYRDSSTSGRLIVTWEDGPGRLGVTEESPVPPRRVEVIHSPVLTLPVHLTAAKLSITTAARKRGLFFFGTF